MKLLVGVFFLCATLSSNYCYSYMPRELKKPLTAASLCKRPKQVVTKQELVMPARMKSNGYGFEDDKVHLAFKPTEHFRYLHIKMYFNGSPFQPIFTAEDLGITKYSNFNKWYQLNVDIEPTNNQGLDNWHLLLEVDGRTIDIDTNYKWKYYWPKYFTMFAGGKSQWIARGNATVCNLLENGQGPVQGPSTFLILVTLICALIANHIHAMPR
ncbi:unnamed protein product [Meganyctiphanes norvegica]|uniref:Uncharacterized protein n=1 Tax=Meganyctiphanes norvegica TaxID=48144 RepID=A0AAV2QBZ3_MEGNR